MTKRVYVSRRRLVKTWLNVGGRGMIQSLISASLPLKRLDKLAAINPVPSTYSRYGLASESNSMYLVTDVVDGTTWAEAALDGANKLGDREADRCCRASSWSRHFAWRPSPGNVMLARESGNVYLIDIPDFSHNTAESKIIGIAPRISIEALPNRTSLR